MPRAGGQTRSDAFKHGETRPLTCAAVTLTEAHIGGDSWEEHRPELALTGHAFSELQGAVWEPVWGESQEGNYGQCIGSSQGSTD